MSYIEVTPDKAKPFKVTVSTRDILKWERGGKGRSLSSFQSDPRMEDVYAMAHIAAVREGKFTGSLSSFEDSCDVVEMSEDDELDPTQKVL